jgi:hypothetical protein
MDELKFQIPSSNIQRNFKHQNSNDRRATKGLELGVWGFSGTNRLNGFEAERWRAKDIFLFIILPAFSALKTYAHQQPRLNPSDQSGTICAH